MKKHGVSKRNFALLGAIWTVISGVNLYIQLIDCEALEVASLVASWLVVSIGFYIAYRQIALSEKIQQMQIASLKKSKNKFLQFMVQTPIGIALLNKDGRFIIVNEKLQAILGYSADELRRKTLYELSQQEDVVIDETCRQALLNGKESCVHEKEFISKDQRHVLVRVTVSILGDITSSDYKYVAAFEDVTEEKARQESLIRADKMELVSLFAGGVAHDFNNALQTIRVAMTMAKENASNPVSVERLVDGAESAFGIAARLANQFLTFAKGGDPVKEIIDVTEVITGAAKISASGRSCRVELNLSDNLWMIEADSGQIEQVVANLIVNAMESMSDDGVVLVKANNMKVVDKNFVSIEVADTGGGIPESKRKKLFDLYYTTKDSGHGLGLSIVDSIVRKHNGYIEVKSSVGRGSTFTVVLPAALGKGASCSITKEKVKKIDINSHVLIMDDDEMVGPAVCRLFEHIGCTTCLVTDGAMMLEAYRKAMATEKPFNLVVMDLTIPGGMGGEEAVKLLHQIDPQAFAVVSSGYSSSPVLANFRDYGFRGFLTKPFALAEIRKLFETL